MALKNKEYKDNVGESIKVGDIIAFKQSNYAGHFKKVRITSFTKTGIPRYMGTKFNYNTNKSVPYERHTNSTYIKTFNQDV